MAVAGAPWDRGQEETGGGCGWHAGWRQHLQAGEQARRAGAPRGQQLQGGNLPENGRGLTEGRPGGEAGWDFAERSSRRGGGVGGQAVSCLLQLGGRGAGSRAGAPQWLEALNPRAGVEAAERRRRCFPRKDGASVRLSTTLGAGSVLTP